MKSRFLLFSFLLFFSCLSFFSCSDDPASELGNPEISFSAETGEYKVKIGKEITIEPTITNAVNPIYSWKLDGKIISTEETLVFKGQYLNEYFVTFRVDSENGTTEKQVKISVVDRLVPEIDLANTVLSFIGQSKEIAPAVSNTDETTTYEWRLEGELVSREPAYTFEEEAKGSYSVSLKVTNEDGFTVANSIITVVSELSPFLFFDIGRYYVPSDNTVKRMSVPFGKSMALAPVFMMFTDAATFRWEVDGTAQSETGSVFNFSPGAQKEYLITVTATEGGKTASTQIKVKCVAPEGTYYREATAKSKAKSSYCFEFIPAPGQFVNYQEGSTAEQARQAIQRSLDNDSYNGSSYMVSLGAFGGYFITGFDHSVKNEEGPDLYIAGNPLGIYWCEPGVIWVMQDENGNGLPDDTWYELAGSETGSPDTKQRYALMYYRPTADNSDILWIDNNGGAGSIDNNGYHTQRSYFPMFIKDEYYILSGTRLKTTFRTEGIETNWGFDWGYVDNVNLRDGFDISDAIGQDGKPVNLQYIDFVKVHTAQLGKGAAVGEVSTEAGAPLDYRMYKSN
ncbi:PKD-like domain-containing protein [uncultured Proteiniphilum sp.]|uniref:PKD-like domain-containing protein n=1 Tax=uncultured Proteiniphilum sp. TaxID=497637 RepID=UPI00261517D8|nr:PKD-like domain-containing protein [uncultured Proteiniphilum sp.]